MDESKESKNEIEAKDSSQLENNMSIGLRIIAGRLLKNPFYAILSCEKIIEGGGEYALPYSD